MKMPDAHERKPFEPSAHYFFLIHQICRQTAVQSSAQHSLVNCLMNMDVICAALLGQRPKS